MKPAPTQAAGGKRTLVVIADGWGPSFGGINAFNLDFCLALGRLLRGTVRVICLTSPVDDETRAEAASEGVVLVSLSVFNRNDLSKTVEDACAALHNEGVEHVDLTIGHDVVTGPVALGLRAAIGGRAAIIHHMSYGSYQGVKGTGLNARAKEEEQRTTLRAADTVLAVGPLLQHSARELCGGTPPVTMLVPGLADIAPTTDREGMFRAIAFGRLGAEDDRIKQGTLAAASYGEFVRRAYETKLGYTTHRFNVFGLSREEFARDERTLKRVVNAAAGRVVNVISCPYTEDRSVLFDALARNEVAMMLSWHEGFGLVGWEAIAAGVPLVVSRASGLYVLLRDDPNTLGAECVAAVDVRGSFGEDPDAQDIDAVASALFAIAVDLRGALTRAAKLRDYLLPIFTWDRCARDALAGCGWGDVPTTEVVLVPVASAMDTHGDMPGASRSPLRSALHGVPCVPPLFLGRDEDIRALKARLGIGGVSRSAAAVQVLTAMRGWPGVGKTSTAIWITHEPDIRAAFPDGVLWASLGESPNLISEIAAWGRHLGSDAPLRAATLSEATAALQLLLRDRCVLLIVDDVWAPEHALPFRQAAPPGSALLITTRQPSVAEHLVARPQEVYNLPVLDEGSALEILRQLAPEVVAANPGECAELVRSLEYLPLALHVAGRLLAVEYRKGWGVVELLHELRAGARRILDAPAPLDRVDTKALTIPTVTLLLQRSTDRLDPLTRERFAYLGPFAPKPATLDLEAMQEVWRVADARPTVRELVDRGLLEPVGDRRFQMHALLVSHAISLCDV